VRWYDTATNFAARAAQVRDPRPAREAVRALVVGEITWAEVGQRPDIVNLQDNVGVQSKTPCQGQYCA
jgi:hypothetical protein